MTNLGFSTTTVLSLKAYTGKWRIWTTLQSQTMFIFERYSIKMYVDLQGILCFDYLTCAHINQFHQIDVFTYNFWVVPMYSLSTRHWALAIIDLVSDRIEIWDSRPKIFKKKAAILSLKALLFNQWKLRNTSKDIPQPWRDIKKIKLKVPKQSNNDDCGVFMLLFAELQSKRIRIMNRAELEELAATRTSAIIEKSGRTSIAFSVSSLVVF